MTNRSEQQEENHHPDTSSDKRFAATVMLDQVKTNEGHAKIDAVQDDLRDERADLDRLEDGRTIVEEIVRTCELLEHLQGHTKRNSVRYSRSSEHGADLRDETALDRAFCQELGLNFFHLSMDGVMVRWSAINTTQGFFGFVFSSFSIRITRCFREEQDADT